MFSSLQYSEQAFVDKLLLNMRIQYTHTFCDFLRLSCCFNSCSAESFFKRWRSFCFFKLASLRQPGQYFCEPALTMYSLPQTIHLSVLPSGRLTPCFLYSLCLSLCASTEHLGHRFALGKLKNSFPHSWQMRVRINASNFLTLAHAEQ